MINGEDCVNPEQVGTKACFHYALKIPAGKSVVLPLRLTDKKLPRAKSFFAQVDKVIKERREEADEFYSTIHPDAATPEECMIQRQALAGMLWSKQIYFFDVTLWLDGDNPNSPPPPRAKRSATCTGAT